MTPIQYFTKHHKVILDTYAQADGQIKQTWDTLLIPLPGLAETMSRNSFKAYLPAFAAGFQVAMHEVMETETVKHELNIRGAEIGDLTKKLDSAEAELNTVKQELEDTRVKHQLNKSGLTKVKQPDKEAPKTIAGWSVQLSGGYYRAFKKIAGKVEGVYIGRVFDADKAKARIAAKEAALTGGRTETTT